MEGCGAEQRDLVMRHAQKIQPGQSMEGAWCQPFEPIMAEVQDGSGGG